MPTIIEEISTALNLEAPKQTKDIESFMRRAKKHSHMDIYKRFSTQTKNYMNEVGNALRENKPIPMPEDYIESDYDNEESDTEKEENKYFAAHRMPGNGQVIVHSVDYVLTEKHYGRLQLPDFQRNQVWKRPARQSFIDSLLNNLLNPTFVFARELHNPKAPYYILDGLQRISTLEMFFNNELPMSSDSLYPDKKYRDLPEEVQSIFRSKAVAVNQIECEEKYWTGIFRTINKGGMPLNSMEIRRAIHGHVVLSALEQISNQHLLWKNVYGRKNIRYAGLEVLLRAVAMHYAYKSYEKPMESFLNQFCIDLDKYGIDPEHLCKKIDYALKGFHLISDNKNVFRMQTSKAAVVNKSLVDCLFHGALLLIEDTSKPLTPPQLGTKVSQLKNKLLNDPDAIESLTKSTSDKDKVIHRMNLVEEIIRGME